jgi:quercetin dioxygenase-like cupin family protein
MFTGDVEFTPLAELPAKTVLISCVTFSPDATTHWHSHAGGQVLHVTGGRGRVQERGGPVRVLEVGDTAVAEAGVEHWHGAVRDQSLTHIAISSGLTTWGQAPDLAVETAAGAQG